ncbi:MAG: SDR family oxidoreductase [bacterium]|nr:SDR family oxidoreductase [bacterium]
MEKKVILVTGTNSGFGYLTTQLLAGKGHTVYAAMRNASSKNKERFEELNATENVSAIEIDVTNSENVASAIKAIIEKEGRLDVVVNNAGYFGGGLAEAYTDKDVADMFDVNLLGVWRTIKNALPQMRAQNDGLIINISSVLGRFSAPFMTVYNSTKFAVEGLSEGLHYELRPLGIDVALIEPGAFPTEIFHKTAMGSDQNVSAGYGEIANIPEQVSAGMGQMFESLQPNPQMVPEAILGLIETPKGSRPLRTVVDGMTGKFAENTNKNSKEDYQQFLTAFGMEALLN